MPDPCRHSPSVAGSCVACTVQQGMAALVWRDAAIDALVPLSVAMDRMVRNRVVTDPAAVSVWLETVNAVLRQAAETEAGHG